MDIHASLASEDFVLGCILMEPELAAYAVAQDVTPEYFQREETRAVVAVALAQFRRDGRCTMSSVDAEMSETQAWEKIGDQGWFWNLFNVAPDPETFTDHIIRMRRAHRLRIFSGHAAALQRDVFQAQGISLREREERMEDGIAALIEFGASAENNLFTAHHIASIAQGVLDGEREQFEPSGITELDAATRGFMPGRVTIIAARPSHGKTAFSIWLSILANRRWRKAEERGQVLFFSAEMGERAMAHRILSTLSGVSALTIASGTLSALERPKVEAAARAIGTDIRITMDTHSSPTSAYMMGRALALHAAEPVRLIVFDYLEYTGEQDKSKDLRLEKALIGCHELAKRIGCPVLVLSQLNRDLERRGKDARPQLADIRYTGAGENIAAMVIMLYHAWTHWKQRGSEGAFKDHEGNEMSVDPTEPDESIYEVLIRKNTHGPVGDFMVEFDRRTASFRDPHVATDAVPF